MYTVMITQTNTITRTSAIAVSFSFNSYEDAKAFVELMYNTAYSVCNTYVSIEDQSSVLSIKTLRKSQ